VTTFFRIPFVREAARPSRFRRGNMHLSARSELKTELSESRIETKLPINEAGLLHVCLTDVRRFTCGCAERRSCSKGRYAPPVHRIKLTETREITPCLWVYPDEERQGSLARARGSASPSAKPGCRSSGGAKDRSRRSHRIALGPRLPAGG
jgi:hypothetical protein